MNRVLVFSGEESPLGELTLMLRQAGVEATVAPSPHALRQALTDSNYDAVIAGLECFDTVPELAQSPAQRIAVTARGESGDAEAGLGHNIDDVLFGPVRLEELRLALHRSPTPRSISSASSAIVGIEGGLAKPWSVAVKAAAFDADILLTGESGTGKELFAKAIHERSPRHSAAFVPLNCAAIPTGLAESLLFGHVEGAFTGAHATTAGVFAKAHRGTLFLDEVGDLSEDVQVKLLRALQTRTIQPLGATHTDIADVRVVAATSRDLAGMMRDGRFREDLYYRLAVVPIALPPLRERKADLKALIDHFMVFFTARHGLEGIVLSQEARDVLCASNWPGNVRELQNTIERLVVLCEGGEIGAELVQRESRGQIGAVAKVGAATIGQGGSLKAALRLVEADFIREALAACQGKRGACAKRLAISPRALLYKLKEYNIS